MIYAQHFSQEEFREWSEDISPRLVTMLDVLWYQAIWQTYTDGLEAL